MTTDVHLVDVRPGLATISAVTASRLSSAAGGGVNDDYDDHPAIRRIVNLQLPVECRKAPDAARQAPVRA